MLKIIDKCILNKLYKTPGRCYSDKTIKLLKNTSVIMCNDSKNILCYHPETEHPIEFTKEIIRKEENELVLKTDLANLYYNRFDSRPAKNPKEHWIDALRLSKAFNEHPITFKRSNRDQRIKTFLEKTSNAKKNRDSI